MPSEPHITISIEGEEKILVALETAQRRSRERLRGLVAGAANYASHWLRIYAPVYTGYTLRHIDQTSARWVPGGAGGSGSWEAVAGVKRGTSKHPLYAALGTGIYVGRGVITAKGEKRPSLSELEQPDFEWNGVGRLLTFQKRGEPRRWVHWVRGQRPKPFLYQTYQQTRLYLHARTLTFGRELFQP